MRIVRGSLTERRAALSEPVGSARVPVVERAAIVLTLEDDDGHVGLGECAPLPGHSLDDLDGCRAELNAFTASLPRVLAADAGCLDAAASLSCPAARFAVECALVDLAARTTDRSVVALFGAARSAVSLNRVVGDLAEVERALADGIATLKVKVGADFAAELHFLAELRERAPAIALRIDANRTFGSDARQRLDALARFEPEFVEEPYMHMGEVAAMHNKLPPVPLAVDESLLDPEVRFRLWPQLPALGVRVVICKPMTLGFAATLELAELTRRAGLDLVLTHLWDGPIGLAAAAQLALIVPGRVRACGLAHHCGLSLWPEIEVPFIGLREASAPGPGLGWRKR